MWLVLKVSFWKDIELEGGLPFLHGKLAEPEDGATGYCDVYDDYDKALKRAGNSDLIVEIGLKKEVK